MHAEWDNEIKRIVVVERIITDVLVGKINKNDIYKNNMRIINKDMWENVGPLSGGTTFDSTPAFLQEINNLKRNISDTLKNDREIKILELQIRSPYFSRIDFQEDGLDKESFYIGVYGFSKRDTGEIIIYDWRAPVSSMFYDYELGNAHYECPSGCIKGELLLKRQYRIEKGQLLLMFDSTIAIEDNILQDILAGNADNRMKIIVSTIQKEQNRAIRCEGKRVLAVQGPAGSGKTSIALHRAAYLLYRHRNSIKADNICLFTPNGIFAKYISSILPELGEDDIPSRTLTGLVQSIVGNLFKRYETYADMMECQLLKRYSSPFNSRLEDICFKSSKKFAAVLERFVEIFESSIICFEDIRYSDTIFATKEELEGLFHESYKYMPIAKRLSRIEGLIMSRVKEFETLRQKEKMEELADSGEFIDGGEIKARSHLLVMKELETVKIVIKNMLSIDIIFLYSKLIKEYSFLNSIGGTLSEETCKKTVQSIENGLLFYEDQVPVLYLMSLLGMVDIDKDIKHVIIDESQDYSEIAFKLFSRLYPSCGITILGDYCQNINPANGIGSLKSAGEILDLNSLEYIEFDKSYRSTLEIMEFASLIINPKAIPFGRHGNKPEVMTSSTFNGICELIINSINNNKGESCRSIAVICRTLNDCNQVYKYVEKKFSISLVASGDDEMPSGVVVIPSYLAKGLEFDAVIVAVLSVDEYIAEENHLFYTICTRALHRLDICALSSARILECLFEGRLATS